MGSKWSGGIEDAFFDTEIFNRNRILEQAETEFNSKTTSKNFYYVIAADVGRLNCPSEAVVIKVTPQSVGDSIKSIVNIYSKEDATMEEQAIWLKQLFYKYKARTLVVDGNGLKYGSYKTF